MNIEKAKTFVEAELAKFIGKDMSDYSVQNDFIACFSRIIRDFHRQGFVVYNNFDYSLTLHHSNHTFVGDCFSPFWVQHIR